MEKLIIVATPLRAEETKLDQLGRSPRGMTETSSIFSLNQFVQVLWSDLTPPARMISPTAEHLILSQVTDEFYRDDSRRSYYGHIARTAGFVRELSAFFNELKSGFVGCEEWDELAENLSLPQEKARELRKLYRLFTERQRSLDLMDVHDANRLLLESLRDPRSRFHILEGVDKIHVHDVYRLDPFRFELFYQLGRRAEVRLHLPLPEEKRKSFSFLDKTWKKIEGLIHYEGAVLPEAVVAGDDGDTEISAFLHSLFSENPAPPPSKESFEKTLQDVTPRNAGGPETLTTQDSGRSLSRTAMRGRNDENDDTAYFTTPSTRAVACFNAYNRYREAEEIASRIVADMENGIEPREIGVIFRDLSVYGPILEDVFNRFGIPFFFRRGNPVRSNPLLKAVLAMFDVIDSGYGREEILKFFTSSYIRVFREDQGSPLLTRRRIEELVLDLHIIQARPSTWKERMKTALESLDRENEEHRELIDGYTILLDTASGFLDELEKLARARNAASFFQQFNNLLEQAGFKDSLSQDLPFTLLHRDLTAYDILTNTLDTLARETAEIGIRGNQSPYTMCKNMLLLALDEQNVRGPGRGDHNQVRVLSAEESVGHRFHTVYLAGLVEGEFPKKLPAHPFLREKDRLKLNALFVENYLGASPEKQLGREPLTPAVDRRDEEALIFFLAAAGARRGLVLSYPSTELGGGRLLRSAFVEDVLEVLGGEESEENILEKPPILHVREELSKTFTMQELVNKTVRGLNNPPVSNVVHAARFLFHRRPERMRSIFSRIAVENGRLGMVEGAAPFLDAIGEYSGLVRDPDLLSRINSLRSVWSPTALETYGECPFSYWMEQVLDLEILRRDKVETDPFSLGIAVHRVLELYHGREQAHKLDESDREACMEKLISEVFDRMEQDKPYLCGEINFWRILREQSRRILLSYVEWDSGFRKEFQPTCVELSIGPSKHDAFAEETSLLEIEEPGEQKTIHRFSGKIDRVDVNPGAKLMRTWDYKYASNRRTYREKLKPESLGVTSFQVPLYLLAAKRHLRDGHNLDAEVEDGGFILLKGLAPHSAGHPEVGLKNKKLPGEELWRMLSDPDYTWISDKGETIPGFQKRLFETIGSIRSGNFMPRPHAADTCAWCQFLPVCRCQGFAIEDASFSESS